MPRLVRGARLRPGNFPQPIIPQTTLPGDTPPAPGAACDICVTSRSEQNRSANFALEKRLRHGEAVIRYFIKEA